MSSEPLFSTIERCQSALAPFEEGDGEHVGYFTGYLNALAWVQRQIREMAEAECEHSGGLVQRPVCEDCGTAFP